MEAFLNGSQAIMFAVAANKDERYEFVEKVLKRFSYARLKRHEKGIVIQFLMKVVNYSRQQVTRLIERQLKKGMLKRYQKTTNGFKKTYTDEDIRLLAKVDRKRSSNPIF